MENQPYGKAEELVFRLMYPAGHPYHEAVYGTHADLEAATRRMNSFIEQCVLPMPEQYLWTHRRFKTRPPGEPPVYRR